MLQLRRLRGGSPRVHLRAPARLSDPAPASYREPSSVLSWKMSPPRRLQQRHLHARSSSEIRAQFLQYFEGNGHTVVPSASLVPPGSDGSLLFTNAGMVPFKQVFLGAESRPYMRATSAQRCVRAGGKHNDLEQVGLTRRHHTQFEMLGNFSFGDYFKEEAIAYAWRFLTMDLGLPRERLHVTVLASDQEARALWKKVTGLSDDQIRDCDETDNFWAMGDVGPCGPCSEIFWDLGDHIADPEERFLELWNLVFMQFDRQATGELVALPKPSVDTGMGLERIASVLQQVPSNYHTDAFVPLLVNTATVLDATRNVRNVSTPTFADALERELHAIKPQFGDSSEIRTLRVVSDHLRTAYAMLHDGIFPSNVGRGYVLRRILRRAIGYAQQHGVRDPFLTQIVVPEWEATAGMPQMRAIVGNEERAFAEMLTQGQRALDKVLEQNKNGASTRVLSGEHAFRLYDTFGIPLDVTQALALERGVDVDVSGFERTMSEHRRKASENSSFTSKGSSSSTSSAGSGTSADVTTAFTGYDSLTTTDARVLRVWSDQEETADQSTCTFLVALTPCPFYAEGGGQVGDRGQLTVRARNVDDVSSSALSITVVDTQRVGESKDGEASRQTIALRCKLPVGMTLADATQRLTDSERWIVDGKVDSQHRRGCAVHHSATHLLQAALQRVLGSHVTQAGSYVSSTRLRFDFAHFGALSLEELERVQQEVNALALKGLRVDTQEMSREEAETSGALATFGEKYGARVRVVRMGGAAPTTEEGVLGDTEVASLELCGGTHVDDTQLVFPFVVLSETSVAAGTRRIEALAGVHAAQHLQRQDAALQQLAMELDTTPAKLPTRVTKLQQYAKQLERDTGVLSEALASLATSAASSAPLAVANAVHVHAFTPAGTGTGTSTSTSTSAVFVKVLRRHAEQLLTEQAAETAQLVVMGTHVVCAANGTRMHAGKTLQRVVRALGGRGGGNAGFAQGSLPPMVTPEMVAAIVLQDGDQE